MPRKAKSTEPKATKTKRKPSAYNNYMSKALKEMKTSHPDMTHMERFKKCASEWKSSKKE